MVMLFLKHSDFYYLKSQLADKKTTYHESHIKISNNPISCQFQKV